MRILQIKTLLVAVWLVFALRPDIVAAGLNPIGNQRQFFFDDAIIETMENTRQKLNPAVKLADNPVIKRDKPWEVSHALFVRGISGGGTG